MRTLLYVDSGDIREVDDQEACDAIASGLAVPCVDPLPKAATKSPETKAATAAPEVK